MRMRILASGIAVLTILTLASTSVLAQEAPTRYAVKDHGAPAYPNPIRFEQPDGKTVTLTLKGDGALHWAESADGYKLVKDAKGFFCYGVADATKGMVASSMPASDEGNRSGTEKTFVSKLDRDIKYSPSLIQLRQSAKKGFLKSASTPQRAFPTSGNRKLLTILVNFSDVSMQRSKAEFNNLFNQKGYSTNGATGCVAEFFSDNSFGKMSLTVDVAGPYTVSQTMSYYGGNNSDDQDSHPDVMVAEAVALANADVDFSQYDNDKDGVVDGVYVVFAGYGEEAGGPDNAIWSHAWEVYPSVSYDGVRISSYSCSPELMLNSEENPTAMITPVGVICHEFSHVCGLPDYYDTDYEKSGGKAPALGGYDPMSSGSWNNYGNTPPYHNSYSRAMLGWSTLREFELNKNNTLLPHYSSSVGYKASTIENEYYIFENRQKVKWDKYIPGHGMVVYHITYDPDIWNHNDININPSKEYFQLVDAGTTQNSSSSPFPGTLGKKSFTSYTTPAFKNWNGTGFNMDLLNITEANEIITVDAKEGSDRKIVVSNKSRIGSISTASVTCAYANATISGGATTTSFYVPNLQEDIPYKATLNGKITINGTIKQSTNSTDTIKLWYNVYDVYTVQDPKTIGGVTVNSSIGETYTSNLQGLFNLYLPISADGVTFTVASEKYHQTSKYLNNQTSSTNQFVIGLVSRIGEEKFSVAPNPATAQKLYIYSKVDKATVYIYNFKGKLVHTQDISTGPNLIQNNAILKGFYIAKIVADGYEETIKIVVV